MSVWNQLKSDERVGGLKRPFSSSSMDEAQESKKLKISLNISDTCNRISEIELSLSEEESLLVSVLDSSRNEEDQDGGRIAINRSGIEVEGYEECEREIFQMVLVEEAINSSDSENSGDSRFSAVLFENDNLRMTTDSDSPPGLATTESDSSESEVEDVLSDRDSGMSDRRLGDVTRLSQRRREYHIQDGIITETGPFIPVSLGIVDDSNDGVEESETEECMDVRCFRLNIFTGDTDMIDDDTSRLLRECGVEDGINTRRYALSGEPVNNYDYEEVYLADESDVSTDEWRTSNDYEHEDGEGEMEDPVEGNDELIVEGERAYLWWVLDEDENGILESSANNWISRDSWRAEVGELEVPVEGNGRTSWGEEEGELEVPVEGNGEGIIMNSRDELEQETRANVVSHRVENGGEDEELEVPVEGNYLSNGEGDMVTVIGVLLVALVTVWMWIETGIMTTEIDRVWDVNGAAPGGGSGAVSAPESVQEAFFLGDSIQASREEWVSEGMARVYRIHDDQDVAVEDESSEITPEVNQF